MKIDKKIIEELVGYLKEFNLSEIEYAEGTTKVKVSRAMNNSSVTFPYLDSSRSPRRFKLGPFIISIFFVI